MTQTKNMSSHTHPLVAAYIEDICSQVRAKDIRQDIQDELLSHLDELVETRLASHPDEDQDTAIRWAIRQMGDATEVAKGLNRVHKPRIPWALLTALGILLLIALIVMDALTKAYASGHVTLAGYNLVGQHMIHMSIGVIALIIISRLPYQRLFRYGNWLYVGIIALMGIATLWGPEINAQNLYIKLGSMMFNVYEISLYIFIVLSAVTLSRSNLDSWRDAMQHFGQYTAVPIVLYLLAPASSVLLIYATANLILLLLYRRAWRWLLPQAGLLVAICSFLIVFSRYVQMRITAFFEKNNESGYIYQQTDEAIRNSSWIGQDAESLVYKLPFLHSESIFTFIVYSLGWLFGIFVLTSIILLILQCVRAARVVRDTSGRMIITAIVIVFAIQYVWNIAMALGLLPILSISMPLFSYGGTSMLAQLSAIGLIYAIYRRIDIVRLPT